jgi:hypothetical protein
LVVGPEASNNAIATIACRRLLEMKNKNRAPSERAVRALARKYGFTYEEPRSTRAKLLVAAGTRSRSQLQRRAG